MINAAADVSAIVIMCLARSDVSTDPNPAGAPFPAAPQLSEPFAGPGSDPTYSRLVADTYPAADIAWSITTAILPGATRLAFMFSNSALISETEPSIVLPTNGTTSPSAAHCIA